MKHYLVGFWVTAVLAAGTLLISSGTCYAANADKVTGSKTSELVASPEERVPPKKIGEEGMRPIKGSDIKEGTYSIDAESSSSMFRIIKAELTVKQETMRAVITLSGKGYLKLFMGTGEEAVAADESRYIAFAEDAEGRYTYEIPVKALNQELECTAFSKRKEKWYDRTILFDAASLPKGALLVEDPGTGSDQSAGDGKDQADSENHPIKQEGGSSSVAMEDGTYQIDVVLTGGTGRTSVTSPAVMKVQDGKAVAEIIFSSPNYDYMKVGNKTYYPTNTEGNSAFEIPVPAFDREIPVIADTTAMSEPHEIEYTLTFSLDSAKADGVGRMPAAALFTMGAAGTGIFLYQRKKKL